MVHGAVAHDGGGTLRGRSARARVSEAGLCGRQGCRPINRRARPTTGVPIAADALDWSKLQPPVDGACYNETVGENGDERVRVGSKEHTAVAMESTTRLVEWDQTIVPGSTDGKAVWAAVGDRGGDRILSMAVTGLLMLVRVAEGAWSINDSRSWKCGERTAHQARQSRDRLRSPGRCRGV